jgi:hypothetical protein
LTVQGTPEACAREDAAYFAVPGAHLYTVLHRVNDPLARLLLVGPFASERQVSYHPWTRWARYLAENHIEAVRFDYRGMGESTGSFGEARLAQWHEDSRLVAEWAANSAPEIPLILHGVELGAIIAARIFDEGLGDALLAWSPAANANVVFRSILKRWYAIEKLNQPPHALRTFAEIVRGLDEGGSAEVEGYRWSGELWAESLAFSMPDDLNTMKDGERPIRILHFGQNAGSILSLPYPRHPIVKDLTPLYRENLEWITRTLGLDRKFR